MAPDPTAAYRQQQGLAPITQSYDPKLVGWIVQAAKQTGADPAALLATSIQESGARLNGPAGDNGTSFGPFQFHVGGALGNHPRQWASTYDAVLNRANEFRRLQVHGGTGAAAVQRPLDRSLYAQGVETHLSQAKAILAKYGLTTPTPASPKATPQTALPAFQTADHADIGNALIQSILDANSQLAGIPQITMPIQQPAAQPAALAPPPLKTAPPGLPPATPTPPGMNWFKPGGGWAGTRNLAQHFAQLGQQNGLSIASEKRDRRMTASGNMSDHYSGNKTAYAYDLSNGSAPTPQMDRTAAMIAAQLGASAQWKKQGSAGILNVTRGGYRFQMLYRTNQGGNHYNHVHLGVRKV